MPNQRDDLGASDQVRVVLRRGDTEREVTLDAAARIVQQRDLKRSYTDNLSKEEILAVVEANNTTLPGNISKDEAAEYLATYNAGLGHGEVAFEGKPHQLDGPGPEWVRDEEGNYPYRGKYVVQEGGGVVWEAE